MLTQKSKLYVYSIILHSIGYDLAWIIAILTASMPQIWLGPTIVVCITLTQLAWQTFVVKQTHGLGLMMCLFLGAGFVFDTLLVQLHLIQFSNAIHADYTSPFMLAIWFNFSVTFYGALVPLRKKYVLISILSLLGFPFAYYIGTLLNAAMLQQGIVSLIGIGVLYSIVVPLVLYIFNKRIQLDD